MSAEGVIEKVAPEEDPLLTAVKKIKADEPDYGMGRISSELKTRYPEWKVSETRLKKLMQKNDMMMRGSGTADNSPSGSQQSSAQSSRQGSVSAPATGSEKQQQQQQQSEAPSSTSVEQAVAAALATRASASQVDNVSDIGNSHDQETSAQTHDSIDNDIASTTAAVSAEAPTPAPAAVQAQEPVVIESAITQSSSQNDHTAAAEPSEPTPDSGHADVKEQDTSSSKPVQHTKTEHVNSNDHIQQQPLDTLDTTDATIAGTPIENINTSPASEAAAAAAATDGITNDVNIANQDITDDTTDDISTTVKSSDDEHIASIEQSKPTASDTPVTSTAAIQPLDTNTSTIPTAAIDTDDVDTIAHEDLPTPKRGSGDIKADETRQVLTPVPQSTRKVPQKHPAQSPNGPTETNTDNVIDDDGTFTCNFGNCIVS